ncbi:MAG: polysaccharide deacetylase family protein [Ktedonobacteraceae bacterium]|nr:polysaccharide deacetylase family protein [Ktedonobacteraceae bacterium]
MNLVSFSIKTKGLRNFLRRLWTVFSRFGFSETRARRSLTAIVEALQSYQAAPTFYIPAVVLRRHPVLMQTMVRNNVEISIHGYFHNDYRSLHEKEQYLQTRQAITIFDDVHIPWQGFRNPYLGWTEELLPILNRLGFAYESNETVHHDVVDLSQIPLPLQEGYQKSLALYRALPANTSTLLPHFEGALLRIPLSIPDDEMLVDRLRMTRPNQVGGAWSDVMQRVYDLEGIYTLNLHPERGVLCRQALSMLLAFAHSLPLPVWFARLEEVARWWKERRAFRLDIQEQAHGCWHIVATCTARATLLARYLDAGQTATQPWTDSHVRVLAQDFLVRAPTCPCIAVSARTPCEVVDFLGEMGYPTRLIPEGEAGHYAYYLDMPEGLGTSRAEQAQKCGQLLEQIKQSNTPLVYFGPWPDGHYAALSITGDIDSVTIQDFFLRILEVSRTGIKLFERGLTGQQNPNLAQ